MGRMVDGGGPASVSDEEKPDWVSGLADNLRFALRRDLAAKILSIDRLGEEEHAWMILSHPALVEVIPGEDEIKTALNAESELSSIINNQPTNTPPMDDLNRLTNTQEQQIESK